MPKGTPNHPRVTAKDVAQDLALPYTAVSHALGKEDGYGVPKETQRRIRERGAEMGFAPVISKLNRLASKTPQPLQSLKRRP